MHVQYPIRLSTAAAFGASKSTREFAAAASSRSRRSRPGDRTGLSTGEAAMLVAFDRAQHRVQSALHGIAAERVAHFVPPK